MTSFTRPLNAKCISDTKKVLISPAGNRQSTNSCNMSEDKVTVDSRVNALPETQAEVEQTLLKLVQLTESEEGCICFDLHQSQDTPCHFRLSETWASKQALEDHLQKPYIKSFLNKAETLLEKPVEITLWKMISFPK